MLLGWLKSINYQLKVLSSTRLANLGYKSINLHLLRYFIYFIKCGTPPALHIEHYTYNSTFLYACQLHVKLIPAIDNSVSVVHFVISKIEECFAIGLREDRKKGLHAFIGHITA